MIYEGPVKLFIVIFIIIILEMILIKYDDGIIHASPKMTVTHFIGEQNISEMKEIRCHMTVT